MIEVEIHIASPQGPRQIRLTGERLTFGRRDASSVVIPNDSGLSRLHASIRRENYGVRIVDEQSSNGSYVNGELVPPGGTMLANGDRILLGLSTTMTIRINAAEDAPVGAARTSHAAGLPASMLIAPVAALFVVLLSAAAVQKITGNADRPSQPAGESSAAINVDQLASPGAQEEAAGGQSAPSSPPSPENSILSTNFDLQPEAEIVEAPSGPRRLYKAMTEEEKKEFIKERAGRIAIKMGKHPYAFTPDALEYIKFWLEAFAKRVGNNRTGLWGGDTRFILARGRVHAPLIIRAFKEHRVPPVVGLYIPFIETEYTNISANNSAGAAGLFQFLGPTAEHYGVPSGARTDVARMAPAAAKYFRDNIMNFGDDPMSVALAIAGYNRAPESVKRDLRNVLNAKNNEDKERNFWTLVANQGALDHFFQSENKNYVPRFFAAAILGENPLAFGIEMRPLSTYTKITDQPPPTPPSGS